MLSQSNFKVSYICLLTSMLCLRTADSVEPLFPKPFTGIASSATGTGHHVIIGPVTNLRVLLKGHSHVVLSWDPPTVYVNHDVTEPSEISPGDKVEVTKIKEHITLVAQNKTDTSSGRATGGSKISPALGIDSLDKAIKWLIKPLLPEDQPHWECKPFSYFANYTVGLMEKVAADVASPVISLKDSDLVKKHELKIKENQVLVPFKDGCLERFTVTWQEVAENKTVLEELSLQVPPNVRIANITGLKPDTSYKVSVIAVFKSEKKIQHHPEVYITTASSNETEECKCEWPGTKGDSLTCNTEPGAKYCTCQRGYEGTFCERCAPGYYRTAPHFPCHACPCNTHGTTQTTCRYIEGFVKCDACEVGYSGSLCHKCSNGFYRYRRRCVPCFCNGNTLKEAHTMCLPTSGMCRNCQYNTTGYHCERCMHDYVGDPFNAKNCTHTRDVPTMSSLSTRLPQKTSSWASPGLIISITLLILLVIAVVGFLVFRRYRAKRWGKGPAFWTVGMSPNADAVDINSVHNHDARLNDDDDDYQEGAVDFRGGKASSKYLRLVEH